MADELSPYLVREAEEDAKEERQLEAGAYGYIYKVTVGGVERIAKRLHRNFTDRSRVSAKEVNIIEGKFRTECITLSKLRHPNIVQFIGVHYGRRGSNDLTLVMECVSTDLYNFLNVNKDVPLSIKLSILRDVSFGLVYLHEYNPPIIHRDLTARNILVTGECQAKIADLGMAKIVDAQAQLANSHTTIPGQVWFMPPEALKEKAACTPKLDIFSFGHLSLYTALQDFPKVYNITITPDLLKQGIVERLKRQSSIDIIGEGHCLYPIITDCLFDSPDKRPNTRNLNERMISFSALNPVSLKDLSQVVGEIQREKEACKKCNHLEAVVCRKDEEMVNLKKELEYLTKRGDNQAGLIYKLTEEVATKERELVAVKKRALEQQERDESKKMVFTNVSPKHAKAIVLDPVPDGKDSNSEKLTVKDDSVPSSSFVKRVRSNTGSVSSERDGDKTSNRRSHPILGLSKNSDSVPEWKKKRMGEKKSGTSPVHVSPPRKVELPNSEANIPQWRKNLMKTMGDEKLSNNFLSARAIIARDVNPRASRSATVQSPSCKNRRTNEPAHTPDFMEEFQKKKRNSYIAKV